MYGKGLYIKYMFGFDIEIMQMWRPNLLLQILKTIYIKILYLSKFIFKFKKNLNKKLKLLIKHLIMYKIL